MFKPGVSGNPSGRPKSDASIRELAKQHTHVAISTLVEIMGSKTAPASARVNAASALLDRGWGKPSLHVESVSVNLTLADALEQIARQEERRGTSQIGINAEVIELIDARPSLSALLE
ncbi:MAG: DUF5681 domain-containing protein [Candidatus Micrarchaeaceae archaeon]